MAMKDVKAGKRHFSRPPCIHKFREFTEGEV
jgi:hypothetical protein